MTSDSEQEYLSGKLLVAMPDMADPRFRKSVILMVAHSDEIAMGVVVNKIAGHLQATGLGQENGQEERTQTTDSVSIPVYFGGPVESERAFIVHSAHSREYESTQVINDDFSLTTTPDILDDLTRGKAPAHVIVALGYAGWAPGQLESELHRNAWLVCDGDPSVVFEAEIGEKWKAALQLIGINPLKLAAAGGTA